MHKLWIFKFWVFRHLEKGLFNHIDNLPLKL